MKLLNLPNELLVAIGSQIQSQSDLEVLSTANRRLHNLLNAELYRRDARTQKSVRWAVRMGRPETLQKALSFVILSDFDTAPLLHVAAENGHASILECLLPLENYWVLNWESLSQFDSNIATTPLAAACQYGHHGAVKVLLDHGAGHTIANTSNPGPLHRAATFGCPIVMGLLLDSGADISSTTISPFPEWTPLHCACVKGNLAAAKLLVDRGANISARGHVGQQPLFFAIDSNNIELVKFLLSKGCNPMSRTDAGQTPLHRAASRHLLDMSKLLISHGSQVCAKTDYGITVLDEAAVGGRDARMVTFLLEAGAEVAIDPNGVSALHRAAAYHASPEVLKALINAGYDVNLKTRSGNTPLYEASNSGNVDSMELLLAEGADVNAKARNGRTMLHAAADSKRAAADAVRLLVGKGANTAALDCYGRSPLDMAISAGNDDVVELLSGNGPIVIHPNYR